MLPSLSQTRQSPRALVTLTRGAWAASLQCPVNSVLSPLSSPTSPSIAVNLWGPRDDSADYFLVLCLSSKRAWGPLDLR